MVPPAKRRKRDLTGDEEHQELDRTPPNSLKKFLYSSPDSKIASPAGASRLPSISPSPLRTQSCLPPSQDGSLSLQPLRNGNTARKLFTKSPSTSPEKGKGKVQKKAKVEEKGKTADLVALFSKQAQKTQADKTLGSQNGTHAKTLNDIASDPISEDDEVADHKAMTSSIVGQNARKRVREGQPSTFPELSTSSQKFLRPPRPQRPPDDEQRPWSERFGPINLDELVVHKKKVADVRRWLEDVLTGRLRQRLLVLKGAAGSGKTTTLRLLARDMGLELLEWKNPTGAQAAVQGYQSASVQFEEFLGRGGRFGQLDIDGDTSPTRTPAMPLPPDGGFRRVIVVEEFPNTFMRSSASLNSFRNTILQFLASSMPSARTFDSQPTRISVSPIVMVISETLLSTNSASADSFTAHRLLGPEILRHPGAGLIEFNSIAPSLLTKALELVVLKEARRSGRRRTPGPLVLKRLGEIGDIRNAVASLEFLCLKGDQDADWGAKVAFTKQKKSVKDGIAMTKAEEETLELVSRREASLGIFHAVGKVVYNKREEVPPPANSPEALAETLPSYMSQYARPKRSVVCVDNLIDETGTDTTTFISALHENYALSCEPPGPYDSMSALDYVNECIEYISMSDLICPSWDVFSGGKGGYNPFGRDQGSHVLRQDEMAFQVAVRGLLFSLPSPVKRVAQGSGKGNDAFKMFYPTSLKLWRDKEELEGVLDVWSTKLLRGDFNSDASSTSMTDGAMAFRRSSKQDRDSAMDGTISNEEGKRETEATPLLSLGSSARIELLLERLPYMAHIGRGRKGSFNNVGLRDIEKITSFRGVGVVSDEMSDDGDEDNAASGDTWATDRPTEDSTPRKKRLSIRPRTESAMAKSPAPKRLVLSDDDIEDD